MSYKYNGSAIIAKLAKRKQSAVEFAKEAGITTSQIYSAIRGRGANAQVLEKIAKALDAKPEELVTEVAERRRHMTLTNTHFKGEVRSAQINSSVPPSLKEKLKKIAAYKGVSVNDLICATMAGLAKRYNEEDLQ